MIELGTNVLSEPMRADRDERVMAWMATDLGDVRVTAVSVGEVFVGIGVMPPGRGRSGLLRVAGQVLSAHLTRVLVYDEHAARIYADLHESRREIGMPLSVEDGMIAAICRRHGTPLATRNTKDFETLGLTLLDPWNQ